MLLFVVLVVSLLGAGDSLQKKLLDDKVSPSSAKLWNQKFGREAVALPVTDEKFLYEEAKSAAAAVAEVASSTGFFIEDVAAFIWGIVLLIIGVPGLWFYERQRARVDYLVAAGLESCRCPSGPKAQDQNSGSLVFMSGVHAEAVSECQDPRFLCAPQGGALRLRTRVEAYQNFQKSKYGSPNGVLYESMWSEVELPTAHFKDPLKRYSLPQDVPLGTTLTTAPKVQLGENFLLPGGLVDQCVDFKPVGDLFGKKVSSKVGDLSFAWHRDGFFYCRPQSNAPASDVAQAPLGGDLRVRFESIPAQAITVMALQVSEGLTASLIPFRLLNIGFGWDLPSAEQQLLVQEGRKPREVLAREGQCLPSSSLCCFCNLLAGVCHGVHTPEVYLCKEGTACLKDCFEKVQQDSMRFTSSGAATIRLAAMSAIFTGFMLVFSQLLDHEPLLKLAMVQLLGSLRRPVCCLIATFGLASLIAGLACPFHRPANSCFWILLALTVVAVPCLVLSYWGELSAPSSSTSRLLLLSVLEIGHFGPMR